MALSAPVMPVKRRAAASLSPVPTGKKPRPSEEEKEKKEKKKREKEELAGIRVYSRFWRLPCRRCLPFLGNPTEACEFTKQGHKRCQRCRKAHQNCIRVEKSDQIDRLLHLHGAIFHLRKLDRATGDLEVELQELVAALTLLQHSNK